ncbi:MAG: hypothetical protein WA419_22740, partial [Silvibacterium sp.]
MNDPAPASSMCGLKMLGARASPFSILRTFKLGKQSEPFKSPAWKEAFRGSFQIRGSRLNGRHFQIMISSFMSVSRDYLSLGSAIISRCRRWKISGSGCRR